MKTENTFLCWIIANMECLIGVYLLMLTTVLKGQVPDIDALIETGYIKTIGVFAVIITAIGTIYIAIYTWIHFDEVVSRRMLWRNSRVALFEMRLGYVFSRFLTGAVTIASTFVFVFLLIFGNWKFVWQ